MAFSLPCVEQAAQESILGTASMVQTFVMVECPPPWTSSVLDSKMVPLGLAHLAQDLKRHRLQPKFFLIHNPELSGDWTRVLIFQTQPGLSREYRKQELWLRDRALVVPTLQRYFQGESVDTVDVTADIEPSSRDLFICIHGTRDRCCGRLGYPLFRSAQALIAEHELTQVRLWQITHLGGHRFAPTLLDLPTGRCYGRVTPAIMETLLTRSGDYTELAPAYRGLSRYTAPLQTLEAKLWELHRAAWINADYDLQVLEQTEQSWQVHVQYRLEQQAIETLWAEVNIDLTQASEVYGSCDSLKKTFAPKYEVTALHQVLTAAA